MLAVFSHGDLPAHLSRSCLTQQQLTPNLLCSWTHLRTLGREMWMRVALGLMGLSHEDSTAGNGKCAHVQNGGSEWARYPCAVR